MTRGRPASFSEWRDTARPLLACGVRADAISWDEPLPSAASTLKKAERGSLHLPRKLMQLLEDLASYRHASRWELMYRLAWRTLFENARLLEDAADRDVARACIMAKAIHRDCHKMHAFVRFRGILGADGNESYFAWFEPEHEILRRGVRFFVKRFPNMAWTIATPDGAAVWDQSSLTFLDSTPPTRVSADSQENLWRTYYRSICNVARINPAAMQREMPQRYWRNLPEAADIGLLIRDGVAQFSARHRQSDEADLRVGRAIERSLEKLPMAVEDPQGCRRCDLWKHATQAVAGAGPRHAALMLVGEQPGDEEDLRGLPFVGPAGEVLDAAIAEAGLDRGALFITNAVKHFKWEPRGKRRMHKKPDAREIDACNVWLEQEIAAIQPKIIVALGASALRALCRLSVPIEAARHTKLVHAQGARVLATYHPSAILRAQGARREELRASLIEDLMRAGESV